jgi:hypothetical protein
LGAADTAVHASLGDTLPIINYKAQLEPHLAIGARRVVAADNDLGVRLEVDKAQGRNLIGLRALDYRYRFDSPIAVGGFAGVARYDLATPAYGLYYGGGGQWRDVLPGWDLNLEYRHAQNISRDHVLATDPQKTRADSFYKIDSVLLYVSKHF